MTLAGLPPITLFGCGAMGGALLDRWLAAGLDPATVTVVDPAPRGLPAAFTGNVVAAATDAPPASVAVLGIKPQMLAEAAPAIAAALRPGALVVSMLAGVTLETLAARLPGCTPARIMPNTPVRIGQGVTAAFAPNASPEQRAQLAALLAPTGQAVWLEREAQFDAFTAVAGSGPAYVFRFIEALGSAARAAGIAPEQAAALARATVTGSAALAAASPDSPADLRRAVTSPNGVTERGLAAMDGIDDIMAAVVRAAAARSAEMGREVAR